MGKFAGAVGGGGSIAAIVVALGWPGAVMIVGLCVITLGLTAWVIADSSRSRHVAMLIRALQDNRNRR